MHWAILDTVFIVTAKIKLESYLLKMVCLTITNKKMFNSKNTEVIKLGETVLTSKDKLTVYMNIAWKQACILSRHNYTSHFLSQEKTKKQKNLEKDISANRNKVFTISKH